ncbi:hypothetical protein [Vibrio sp. TRT 17S01]|uniref:hypothetical protein n=1 Tax=Vibrio sp. TRT 17S01 TaxID=3418505 RepID=UPI003CF641E9
MKIKLTTDLPIADKHGAKKGRVFEVIGEGEGRQKLYYFIGDTGEKCGAFARSECVVVEGKHNG